MKPTADILERIFKNSCDHKDGVYTRLYRYLLREDIYYQAYQKLYANKGASTEGIDGDTADGFGEKYVKQLIDELANGTYVPKPVRRTYIKKQNGKMRPLGIPSFRDKLLQEAVRCFLEAIYESTFCDFSHGFRPNRSCHTALRQAQCYFVGARWFIEGDIKGCFDNIDHAKLIEVLERKIKDSRFINIIRAFLKAGYVEDWEYHRTYSGTPQGGILSPVLANIYLNELDNKIMEMKQLFDKPADRRYTPEYALIRSRMDKTVALLKTATGEQREMLLDRLRMLKKQQLQTPAKQQTDKKITFVRYADDFLIAVNGSKEDCQQIKDQLATFLLDEYKLTLNDEKTLITHSSNQVRFLGYDLSVRRSQEIRVDSIGRKSRIFSGTIELLAPAEKIERFMFDRKMIRQTRANTFRAIHRKNRLYLSDLQILDRFNAEIRGILNYYSLASNYRDLAYFCYLMEYSCLATLAAKHDSSIGKIIKEHKCGTGWAIQYKLANGTVKMRKIVKLKDCKGGTSIHVDTEPAPRFNARPDLTILARLRGKVCELCSATGKDGYEVHLVPSVNALEGDEFWKQVMRRKKRKTLIVCEECHRAIHNHELIK